MRVRLSMSKHILLISVFYPVGTLSMGAVTSRSNYQAAEGLEHLEAAAQAIYSADAIVFCSGAGMGCDSGLPDFRGKEGFWKAYPPFKDLNVEFSEMSTPRWFKEDPNLAWGFFGHRYNLYTSTQPHEGFQILKSWGESKPGSYFVFTSNVDGHYDVAGYDPDRIVEVHGGIRWMQCSLNCTDEIWPAGELVINVDDQIRTGDVQKCKNCDAVARPNILMFGDGTFNGDRSNAQEERLDTWLCEQANSRLVIVEIGAGLGVPTVRMFSEATANQHGNACLIRINPREPEVPVFDGGPKCLSLCGYGLDTINKIQELLEGYEASNTPRDSFDDRFGVVGLEKDIQGLFVYGTLRDDDPTEVTWRERVVTGATATDAVVYGATLYQEEGVRYPYAVYDADAAGSVDGMACVRDGSVLVGRLLSWDNPAEFAKRLAAADEVEGYRDIESYTHNGQHNLYNRTIVDAVTSAGETVKAYMYYRTAVKPHSHKIPFNDWCKKDAVASASEGEGGETAATGPME